jgi:hypothetical protein
VAEGPGAVAGPAGEEGADARAGEALAVLDHHLGTLVGCWAEDAAASAGGVSPEWGA